MNFWLRALRLAFGWLIKGAPFETADTGGGALDQGPVGTLWTLLSVFAVALILNKVDNLFGREVGWLLWLYAVAALVDIVILGSYVHDRRQRRV